MLFVQGKLENDEIRENTEGLTNNFGDDGMDWVVHVRYFSLAF